MIFFKFKNSSAIFIFCIFFSSCGSNRFYDYYEVEDLWRFPLIYPYELKTIRNASLSDDYNNWNLNFKYIKDIPPVSSSGVHINKINVKDSIIYGYGTIFPCFHFIINCKTGKEKIFTSVSEWERTLLNNNLDPQKLYDVFEVFYAFKDNHILPWDDQIGK